MVSAAKMPRELRRGHVLGDLGRQHPGGDGADEDDQERDRGALDDRVDRHPAGGPGVRRRVRRAGRARAPGGGVAVTGVRAAARGGLVAVGVRLPVERLRATEHGVVALHGLLLGGRGGVEVTTTSAVTLATAHLFNVRRRGGVPCSVRSPDASDPPAPRRPGGVPGPARRRHRRPRARLGRRRDRAVRRPLRHRLLARGRRRGGQGRPARGHRLARRLRRPPHLQLRQRPQRSQGAVRGRALPRVRRLHARRADPAGLHRGPRRVAAPRQRPRPRRPRPAAGARGPAHDGLPRERGAHEPLRGPAPRAARASG